MLEESLLRDAENRGVVEDGGFVWGVGLFGGDGDQANACVDEVDEFRGEMDEAVAVRVFDAFVVSESVPAFRAVLGWDFAGVGEE